MDYIGYIFISFFLLNSIQCLNCPVISDTLKPSYVVGVGWVKPGRDKPDEPFVHPEVKRKWLHSETLKQKH